MILIGSTPIIGAYEGTTIIEAVAKGTLPEIPLIPTKQTNFILADGNTLYDANGNIFLVREES